VPNLIEPLRPPDAPIETIFLDAGGVLLFPNWDRVSDVFRRHGIAVSANALQRAEPAIKFAIDAATEVESISDADRGGRYFDGILDNAGVPRSPSRTAALSEIYAYHMEHNLWEHVAADVRPALERLRGLGAKLAVVSNANGVLQRVLDRVGLSRFFDAVCDSFVEGVEKPDPRLFALALNRTQSRAETTLHVGDLFHVDVVGARRAGLRAVLIDPHGLYGSFDVDRVRDLSELAGQVGAAMTDKPSRD
jgi:HAD superfamily hydrolase (TIGR01549 family)